MKQSTQPPATPSSLSVRRISFLVAAASGLALGGFLLSFALGAMTSSSYKVLYAFAGPDGAGPSADLAIDAEGNLYGTTSGGGTGNGGTVFELKRTTDGWKWQALYNFAGGFDGWGPFAGVTFDTAGNLYGTTEFGGSGLGREGKGTVFRLLPNSKGGWAEQVLYRFTGRAHGRGPTSDLVFDKLGNLYGTTGGGINAGHGTIFELSPQGNGSWVETTLHAFKGKPDGAFPTAGLVLDGQGYIYGLTQNGGVGKCHLVPYPRGCGTLYELAPDSSGWKETILYSFVLGGGSGKFPSGGLTQDSAGDLYGTTEEGGDGFGVVFRLARAQKHGYQETVLYRFYGGDFGPDGEYPRGRLVMNAQGNLFGVTGFGGSGGWGTVFEVHPGSGMRERILHAFAGGSDGSLPLAGVISDAQGFLYGTTVYGGGLGGSNCSNEGCGTVYQLKP
jgi:uncharacterized repeat protein (TIGR03803 family)